MSSRCLALMWSFGLFSLAGCGAREGANTGPDQPPLTASLEDYEVVQLGTLEGVSSIPTALDDAAPRVIGITVAADGTRLPFLWQGSMQHLETPAGAEGAPTGFSGDGTVVGWVRGNDQLQIVRWSTATMVPVGPAEAGAAAMRVLPGAGSDVIAEVAYRDNYDIRTIRYRGGSGTDLGSIWIADTHVGGANASGLIVGASAANEYAGQPRHHAFLWDGALHDLGTLDSGPCTNERWCDASDAFDINSRGEVVGFASSSSGWNRAFLWRNGVMTDLGIFPGEHVRATHINERGRIAGEIGWEQRRRAFVWDAGTVRELGSLGGGFTRISGMTEAGDIIGTSRTAAGEWRAFLWQNGRMIDLHPGYPATQSSAIAINARGDIIGVITAGDPFLDTPRQAVLWRRSRP